ncbi:AGAP007582-PA-like protein [Anopheles sinensis]|uniref:AGAP007582-PA-like protein n=1 Tax=Anopheles sinensis TaxID=74873 RepID=A0A084WF07_ANOSI|nr:AGAP007582-PA-like protein [Anopheles sinensis]
MSKRLKYAKLRLVKSDSNVAAPMQAAAEQQSDGNDLNTGENILRSCKKSKFFTAVSSSQATFVEIDDEQSDDSSKEPMVQNSRRRTQSEDVCPSDGPKLPKLRKKTLNGNGLISNFLNTQIAEDDDFEESRQTVPVPQPKQTKVQRAAKKPKPPRKPKNQSDIRKIFKKYKSDYDVLHELIKDHSASEQVDPEQLQMALAMSRSLADQECSSGTSSSKETHLNSQSSSTTSEERRIIGIRTTLEQFGFRCKNSYTDYDLNVIFGAGCKNVKKIKHRRATNLQLRTREELCDFIDRKTRKMFPNEITPPCTDSHADCAKENPESCLCNLFWIAQTEQESSQLLDQYYVPELMEADPAPVGYLLKDWSKIPGRETTPERTICDTVTGGKTSVCQDVSEAERTRAATPTNCETVIGGKTSLCQDVSETERTREASPDLFDDLDSSMVHSNQLKDTEELVGCVEQVIEDHSSQPSTAQKLFNQSEEQNIKDTSLTTHLPGKEHKELEEDQGNRSVCGLTASEVEDCEDNLKNQDIIEIESEDESSNVLEASNAEVPILHRSTENIFDETDMEPIVSFEVYSEEEKISTKAHQEKPISKEDTQQPNQGAIDSTDNEQFDNTNPTAQPLVESNAKCMQNAEFPQCAVVNDEVEVCAVESIRGEKKLSFNRIAINARLSEALETSGNRVETVDLVDYTPSVDETMENNNSSHENSIVDVQKNEAVVNEPIEEVPVDKPNTNSLSNLNRDERSKSNASSQPLENAVDKNGHVNLVSSPFAMDVIDHDLEEDTLPNLRVKEAELEVIESDKNKQDFSSAMQDQDNFGIQSTSLKARTNGMPSPTDEMACPTTPECQQPKANRFEDKFSELKAMASPVKCPEYLISVKNVDFEIPSYETMSTPQIERELFKKGLKER